MIGTRDHGGGVDAAAQRYGGARADWIDLSTGINPVPYPLADLPSHAWSALPDQAAQTALENAARQFWCIPNTAAVIAAPGASALIARLPALASAKTVDIPAPTCNEHWAAFLAHGWLQDHVSADANVIVHPNNPTGHWYTHNDLTAPLTIIDESFADTDPARSTVPIADQPGRIVLKSFGKFWGLAGMRLGFAIGRTELVERLSGLLGPWPVSGPAQFIGTRALNAVHWAKATRARLADDAARLDSLVTKSGADIAGGTTLFRLYRVDNASAWQERLAQHKIWTSIFPYATDLIRFGLPGPLDWARVEAAL